MSNEYSIADARYKAIKKREYNYLLCLFIYEKLKSNLNAIDIKISINIEFSLYCPKKNLIDEYNKFLQKRRDSINNDLYKKINEVFPKLAIRKKNALGFKDFKNLCDSYDHNFISLKDFRTVYKQNKDNRCCGYCGISEKQISKLDSNEKINTKRLSTRGKKLEIDRIRPHELYSKDNILLSCYWCNNAKTDEFELDEFELIARGINDIFAKRLNTDIEFPNYDNYKQT